VFASKILRNLLAPEIFDESRRVATIYSLKAGLHSLKVVRGLALLFIMLVFLLVLGAGSVLAVVYDLLVQIQNGIFFTWTPAVWVFGFTAIGTFTLFYLLLRERTWIEATTLGDRIRAIAHSPESPPAPTPAHHRHRKAEA
jgi:hypothetical protein